LRCRFRREFCLDGNFFETHTESFDVMAGEEEEVRGDRVEEGRVRGRQGEWSGGGVVGGERRRVNGWKRRRAFW